MSTIRMLVVCLIGWALFTSEAPAEPVQGGTSQIPNVFRSMASCQTAMKTGQFRFYEPQYLGDNKKNPVNGKDKVKISLPYDLCIELYTVVGWRFVAQKKSTPYRAVPQGGGVFHLYARDDCGNDARGRVTFPPSEVVITPVATPTPTPYRTPIKPRPVATPTPMPTPVPTPMPSGEVKPPQASLSQWGLTASGMVGAFDSIPIGGDGGLIESIVGRRVYVKGRTIDLGLARGGIAQSFWRFTLVSKSFTNGSFTEYKCTNCTQEVRMVEGGSVRTLGLQIERVHGFNNKTWGAIRPMVSVNVGAGRISGSVRRLSGPVGKPVVKGEVVPAGELFGSRWVANAGVGVGVMGDLGKHFTYAVTVVGVEYPGSYFGRVSLTYWSKKK